MTNNVEIELKFQVPRASRAPLLARLLRGRAPAVRTTLAARYLDTADRRLASAGLAWRLRREGRRWVQALKAPGAGPLERFEHEVVLSDPLHDAARHAGTPAGDGLLHLLAKAREGGREVEVRFHTQVRRTSRRLRTPGAVVEVSLDEGRLTAGALTERILEVEFELVSGSAVAMLGLAERWRAEFGLVLDPRSKAERGDRLAEGSPYPPLRKAMPVSFDRDAGPRTAFTAVLDECLMHVGRNAVGLVSGDPDQRVEHVHQMRVGIRRLRSALRCFRGWVPAAPPELVERSRELFARLGEAREADVLGSGVMADLHRAGAPALAPPLRDGAVDPVAIAGSAQAQQLLLAWIAWRVSLGEVSSSPDNGDPDAAAVDDAKAFHRRAGKRIDRWHRALADDAHHFDELGEAALHDLRKRLKRQRYAVEFFEPLLPRKGVKRYLEALSSAQDGMGALNDLFVARAAYQQRVAEEPAAWFALGWLAARVEPARANAGAELRRAVKVDVPAPR